MVLFEKFSEKSMLVYIDQSEKNIAFMRTIIGKWRKKENCWIVSVSSKERVLAFLNQEYPEQLKEHLKAEKAKPIKKVEPKQTTQKRVYSKAPQPVIIPIKQKHENKKIKIGGAIDNFF